MAGLHRESIDVSTTSDLLTSDNGIVAEPADPCPAPLAWQDVLAAFRTDADVWELRQPGCSLRGRTWGSGPPLYLIPPLGGTHELFALLVWLLREDFRCVAYDECQIEHGARLTPQRLAEHLLAAADLHGDERFRIFAPAFASVAALTAMLSHGSRIEAAALQGGFAQRTLSRSEKVLIRLAGLSRRKLAAVPLRVPLARQNHLPWFAPIDPGRWSFFVDDTGQVSVASLAARAGVLRQFDVRERLGEVTQPILLVRTEGEGRLAGRCQELLAERLPDARVERLHSSGQLPYLTHPHRLAKLLKSFFLGSG